MVFHCYRSLFEWYIESPTPVTWNLSLSHPHLCISWFSSPQPLSLSRPHKNLRSWFFSPISQFLMLAIVKYWRNNAITAVRISTILSFWSTINDTLWDLPLPPTEASGGRGAAPHSSGEYLIGKSSSPGTVNTLRVFTFTPDERVCTTVRVVLKKLMLL